MLEVGDKVIVQEDAPCANSSAMFSETVTCRKIREKGQLYVFIHETRHIGGRLQYNVASKRHTSGMWYDAEYVTPYTVDPRIAIEQLIRGQLTPAQYEQMIKERE